MKTIEGRVNEQELATCIDFYRKEGIVCRTISSLITQMVSDLAAILVKSGKVKPFTNTEAAIEFIALQGFGKASSKNVISLIKTNTKRSSSV